MRWIPIVITLVCLSGTAWFLWKPVYDGDCPESIDNFSWSAGSVIYTEITSPFDYEKYKEDYKRWDEYCHQPGVECLGQEDFGLGAPCSKVHKVLPLDFIILTFVFVFLSIRLNYRSRS